MGLLSTTSNLEICDFFGDDLDKPMLKFQLTMSMKELFKDTKWSTVKEVMAVLEAKKGCINLLGEVDKQFICSPSSKVAVTQPRDRFQQREE